MHKMLASFKSCDFYLNQCIAQILRIVISTPQFNNERDVEELFDIYVRKFIKANRGGSALIAANCTEFVDFWFHRNRKYYRQVFESFETRDDAYHYLAILAQFHRICNLFRLRSASPCKYLVVDNAIRFCLAINY